MFRNPNKAKNKLRARPIEQMGRCQACGKHVKKNSNLCANPRCARAIGSRLPSVLGN